MGKRKQMRKCAKKVCEFCGGLVRGTERRWTTATRLEPGGFRTEALEGYFCGWCAVALADVGWDVVRHYVA